MAEILMPRLSDTMQEGVLSRWLKKVGDPVHKGDVLAESRPTRPPWTWRPSRRVCSNDSW